MGPPGRAPPGPPGRAQPRQRLLVLADEITHSERSIGDVRQVVLSIANQLQEDADGDVVMDPPSVASGEPRPNSCCFPFESKPSYYALGSAFCLAAGLPLVWRLVGRKSMFDCSPSLASQVMASHSARAFNCVRYAILELQGYMTNGAGSTLDQAAALIGEAQSAKLNCVGSHP